MLKDKFLKSGPTSKIFISVSTIAIVTLITYGWIVTPQISHLHAAQQQKVMIHNAEKKNVSLKSQIHKQEAELTKLQNQVEAINDSFFTLTEAHEFFSDLEMTALQCGCNISSLTFMSEKAVVPETDHEFFSSVVLKRAEITLTGQYDGILTFFAKLNQSKHLISIGSLLIKPNSGNTDDLICSTTITIYIIENKETISNE
jgi:Tfp pilus assembly protein PilO